MLWFKENKEWGREIDKNREKKKAKGERITTRRTKSKNNKENIGKRRKTRTRR